MHGPPDGTGGVLAFDASSCYGSGGTPTPTPGDLNSDHVVNSSDSTLLISKWFQSFSSYDLIIDSLINSLDFGILSGNWGKTW
jgi:hypothetical protein